MIIFEPLFNVNLELSILHKKISFISSNTRKNKYNKSMLMLSLGEKIKELRLDKGLTQSQLAGEIGVSQSSIDYWERNINDPKSSYIIAMVKCFGISYDEFFADIE